MDVVVFIGEVGIGDAIDDVEFVMFNVKVVVVSFNGVEDIDEFIDELTNVVGIVEMVVVVSIWKGVVDVFIDEVSDVVGIFVVGVDVLRNVLLVGHLEGPEAAVLQVPHAGAWRRLGQRLLANLDPALLTNG